MLSIFSDLCYNEINDFAVRCVVFQFTGEYEKYVPNKAGEFSFYTFTPRPLMSGDFFVVDEELSATLAKAHRELGILEGTVKHLPDRDIICDLMIAKECYFSRLIDYKDDPFSAFLKASSLGKEEANRVQNIISAYKFSQGESAHGNSLREICRIALLGNDFSATITERDKAIFLGGAVSNLKAYNPTAPNKILPALADIAAFLYNDEKTDILAKAALAHYQFEMIHPYECYNGVVGRIMIPMIMQKHGIEAASLMGLSEFLYYNKNDYFEILRTTQYSAGYIALIKFFVRGIYEAAKTANERIEKMLRIITDDEIKITARGLSTKRSLMIYTYFKSHIFSQIKVVSNDLGFSFNTVAKTINVLCEFGVLQLESSQSRHRVFVYSELLDALSGFSQQ